MILSILSTMLFSMASFGIQRQQIHIEDFVYERDVEEVLKIIQNDWNALFTSIRPTYDQKYLLQNEVPGKEFAAEKYDGNFKMKVARKEEGVVGLVSFYEQDSGKGRIRLISVAQDCNEMGYDKTLTVAAIKGLFDAGCTSILLYTREDNEKTSMYESLGFHEIGLSDDDISWFEEIGIYHEEYSKYTRYELKNGTCTNCNA